MWATLSVLVVALDVWIILMQLTSDLFSGFCKEGFQNVNNMSSSDIHNKNTADITENQSIIIRIANNVQIKLAALQKELITIEEQVIKNTASLKKCQQIVSSTFATEKKQRAAMQKKLIAVRQGKIPKPPWPGVAPPSSMLPVPIQ